MARAVRHRPIHDRQWTAIVPIFIHSVIACGFF
jgi:hypothetical protein